MTHYWKPHPEILKQKRLAKLQAQTKEEFDAEQQRKRERRQATLETAKKMAANSVSNVSCLLANIQLNLERQLQVLFEVKKQLEELQPKNGSIHLELYACGKKCNGCPHVRWVQYNWKKSSNGANTMRCINLDDKDPIMLLKKSNKYYKDLVGIIRIAKKAIAQRANLLSYLQPLWLVSKTNIEPDSVEFTRIDAVKTSEESFNCALDAAVLAEYELAPLADDDMFFDFEINEPVYPQNVERYCESDIAHALVVYCLAEPQPLDDIDEAEEYGGVSADELKIT